MSVPLRICIAAENASVRMGGEAILPFHYFRQLLGRGYDVHLVVHERCRGELLELFAEHAARLHFVPDLRLQKLFFRLSGWLPRRVAEATLGLATQLLTQRSQRRLLRKLHTPRCVIHQPTPVAPRFPSWLTGLRAPLIVGPLNGGMEFPVAFRGLESRGTRAIIILGRAFTNIGNAIFRGKREASVVLVANERTRAALPAGLRGKIIALPENAVDPEQWQGARGMSLAGVESKEAARFLFMGRLVDWKALDIVLDALTQADGMQLDIMGDGPMREVWETQAYEAGLQERVRFHGWQTQGRCAELLQEATALVLPSLYESGGAVVLEAMAAGKPVIATAWGGPMDYLDAHCGILLAPASRAALVSAFAEAMQRLAASPALCSELGDAGRAKVSAEYSWPEKIDRMLTIYESVLRAG